MKVIVCFGDNKVLVPCEEGDDMTVRDLTERAVARYKKVTNKNQDDEIKVSYLKTQSEGAIVDADDKVADVAEDKDVFTAVCEEPLPQLVNTGNGQVVLAVINHDGGQPSDSAVHTIQLSQAGSLTSNLTPVVSSAVGMLHQSMMQQTNMSSSSSATALAQDNLDEDNLGVEQPAAADSEDKDDTNEFACDQCPQKFKQSWKLRQHLIAHARQNEMKKYECDKCAASFISEWLLQRHAKIHTGTNKPRFCLVCNRAFRGSTDLKVHMRVHTGEKPFKCDTCGKAFGDRSALRRHNMTHTGHKPRPCPHCPLAFRQTAPLIQHLRVKHNINIRHRCDVCYMSFCEDDAYIIHMANVHRRSVTVAQSEKDDAGEEMAVAEEELQSDHQEDSQNENEDKNVNQSLEQAEEEEKQEESETQALSQNEQVEAERSIQEAYMTETVSTETEQEGIAITTTQEGQDIVLPTDLVVAHQLIAVQQSNIDVQ